MIGHSTRRYASAYPEAERLVARSIENRFLATLHGAEHLPRSGGALLVGNHAYLGVDAWVLRSLLVSKCNLIPRFLGDQNLWRIPLVNRFLTSVGAVPGKPDAAVELLEAGEIVIVYPGGVDDSFKLSNQAYTLQWGNRAGFARVAMRAKVPIIPVPATGVDELYQIDKRESRLGRAFTGSSRYDIPLPTSPLPRRIPLDYYVLEPVDTSGDPTDETAVERVRQATMNAMRSVLDPYRERIRG